MKTVPQNIHFSQKCLYCSLYETSLSKFIVSPSTLCLSNSFIANIKPTAVHIMFPSISPHLEYPRNPTAAIPALRQNSSVSFTARYNFHIYCLIPPTGVTSSGHRLIGCKEERIGTWKKHLFSAHITFSCIPTIITYKINTCFLTDLTCIVPAFAFGSPLPAQL